MNLKVAAFGEFENLKLLVLYGADLTHRAEEGYTAAHAALWYAKRRANREREREFFIDSLLVRIHYIIVMVRWTGLAPWEFEFPFPSEQATKTNALRTFTGKPRPDSQNLALTVFYVPYLLNGGVPCVVFVHNEISAGTELCMRNGRHATTRTQPPGAVRMKPSSLNP